MFMSVARSIERKKMKKSKIISKPNVKMNDQVKVFLNRNLSTSQVLENQYWEA